MKSICGEIYKRPNMPRPDTALGEMIQRNATITEETAPNTYLLILYEYS